MAKTTRRRGNKKEKSEFDQYILDLARVTRVTRGGKQLSFRACVVLGDRNGRVGFGVAKGKDVQIGVEKAVRQAKKNIVEVPIIDETIPHPINCKFKAAAVFLKPAPKGSGIIAGGPVRMLLELAGVPNVSAKIMGKTKNKISIVKAVLSALQMFKQEALAQASKAKAAKKAQVDAKKEQAQSDSKTKDKTVTNKKTRVKTKKQAAKETKKTSDKKTQKKSGSVKTKDTAKVESKKSSSEKPSKD